jgi:hypothetical protein
MILEEPYLPTNPPQEKIEEEKTLNQQNQPCFLPLPPPNINVFHLHNLLSYGRGIPVRPRVSDNSLQRRH